MKIETERKYLVAAIPPVLDQYERFHIEQGYLSVGPVLRIRKSNDAYYLTEKGPGLLSRSEDERPISREEYREYKKRIISRMIVKDRYKIPLGGGLYAELDIFHEQLAGLVTVEVEFPSEAEAARFVEPDWFGEEITYDKNYKNSHLSFLDKWQTP